MSIPCPDVVLNALEQMLHSNRRHTPLTLSSDRGVQCLDLLAKRVTKVDLLVSVGDLGINGNDTYLESLIDLLKMLRRS